MQGRQGARIGAVTHPGQIRELNEDSIGTPDLMKVPAHLQGERGQLLAVADGMGGHAAGEVASQQAVQVLFEEYYNDSSPDLAGSLKRAVEQANARIHAEASSDFNKHGMGTTLVAAVILDNRLIVANVGDSRAYLVRRGQIRQISLDHSWVAESVAAGLISQEQAKHHTRRNLVMRALGHKPDVEVDLFQEKLRPGDAVVLCSDGLSNEVSDGEMAQVVSQRPAQEGARSLVALANSRLGRDNISAVVFQAPARQGRAIFLPLVVLGGVLLAGLLAAALLLAGGRTVPPTVARKAATPTVVGAVASPALFVPAGETTSPLPTPAPSSPALGLSPTPVATVVASALPTRAPTPLPSPTWTAVPSTVATLAEALPARAGLACPEGSIALELGWGVESPGEGETYGQALRGLCDMLGHAGECCQVGDFDLQEPFDESSPVLCSLPRSILTCWRGTVRDFTQTGRAARGRLQFGLDTEEGGSLAVVLAWRRERQLQRPYRGWLTNGREVAVCGLLSGSERVTARLIVLWTLEGVPQLWFSSPRVADRVWLAGTGGELQALLQAPQPVLGERSVLVYSQWEMEPDSRQLILSPVQLAEDQWAIFGCRDNVYSLGGQ